MKKRLALGIFMALPAFTLFFAAFSLQGAESTKACFVGYSEYNILTYKSRVNAGGGYRAFLDTLANYKVNFVRVWPAGYGNWESYGQLGDQPGNCPNFVEFLPFKRSGSGNKYNLTDYDPSFFTDLRDFVSYAKTKGIAVELTFFDSWGLKHLGEWAWNPWDCNYNVNGRICGSGCGTLSKFFDVNDATMMNIEKGFVQKVVAETSEYDNVLYEVMNEPQVCGYSAESKVWHNKVIEWVREKHPNAQIAINDPGSTISGIFGYDFIALHYGAWKDGIAQAIQSLSSYGKHVIIDDDGCPSDLRRQASNQQAWSNAAINNGASFNHLQDDLYCNYYIVSTSVLNALKTAGEQCTSFPFVSVDCSDGTPSGQCSATKPKYCSSGSLINKCSTCGCPAGQACLMDGSCSSSAAVYQKKWDCTNGFSNCYTPACGGGAQLRVSSNVYEFPFTVPQAGNYHCSISVVANHFDYISTQETNEVVDVKLNGNAVGTTTDSWCPPGSGGSPTCSDNIPDSKGMITNGMQYLFEHFEGYGDTKFCKKGYVEFKVSYTNAQWDSESTALQSDATGEKIRNYIALGNTKNRNMFHARLQWYPEESKFIVKLGGGTCVDCMCCACWEGAMKDGWCGSAVGRPWCPTFNRNEDVKYRIRWDATDPSNGKVCLKKLVTGAGERCFDRDIQIPFALNSYCVSPNCAAVHYGMDRTSKATTELTAFHCDVVATSAPQSCNG
jgi:hypothetical protein